MNDDRTNYRVLRGYNARRATGVEGLFTREVGSKQKFFRPTTTYGSHPMICTLIDIPLLETDIVKAGTLTVKSTLQNSKNRPN